MSAERTANAVDKRTTRAAPPMDGADVAAETQPAKPSFNGPEEYARLDLQMPVPLEGGAEANEIIIYRPACRAILEVMAAFPNTKAVVEHVASTCCRAATGSGEPKPFSAADLGTSDAVELIGAIQAFTADADQVQVPSQGDGISSPLVYTLQRPIRLTPSADAEIVRQIEFQAKRMKDISDYLDASTKGEVEEFFGFMRNFAMPLGVRIPIMSDLVIGAMDFLDTLVIKRSIMGKLVFSRGRLKRASSPAASSTTGHPAAGLH